jgi:hypothetical protein
MKGCKSFLGCMPVVFTLDEETEAYSQKKGYKTIPLFDLSCEPQVASLYILKECTADFLILIDVDCWPLKATHIDGLLSIFESENIAGIGDVGFLDMPYLFKNLSYDKIFEEMHKILRTFRNFADKWISAIPVSVNRLSSGAAVDIPLLYGGFAIYRTACFKDLSIPSWIHSADIWLNIFAVEHDLHWHAWGDFQFNKTFDDTYTFFHLAGKKPDKNELEQFISFYENFIITHQVIKYNN